MRDWSLVAVADRRRTPELMDQPGLDLAEHARALAGLRRINRVSRSAAIYWRALRRFANAQPGTALRVLDVASGGGDVAIDVARRSVRRGAKVLVDACDISPFAVRYASARAAERQVENVSFFRCDVLEGPLPEGYDVVMCSLFLHHLDDETAVALLTKMAAAAKKLVVVNDLRRSTIGYLLAWFGCRVLTRSPVVHVDGPRSVEAAFSMAELRGVAQRSGLGTALLQSSWPCRMLLQWRPA
jgi:2-polyprenyl-3-methyl-5-hydroxy-6-metoxy-1,4-benzoquinol methylase